MKIPYNKLVRDKIPEIITNAGKSSETYILEAEVYIKYLKKKLSEELDEYNESGEIEELADILEIIYAIAKTENVTPEELESIRLSKHDKRGGFDNRIFLVSVTE